MGLKRGSKKKEVLLLIYPNVASTFYPNVTNIFITMHKAIETREETFGIQYKELLVYSSALY